MKTYSQLILELTEAATATKRKKPFDSVAFDAMQKARYGSVMAKAAADALAAAQKKKAALAPRKPFPWMTKTGMMPGWWHPAKGWFTFSISNDGYHVTKIVSNPEKFGISQDELLKAAKEEAGRGLWNNKSRAERGLPPMNAEIILNMIDKEEMDSSLPISMLAYKRGWLRVYGGEFHTRSFGGTLEGSDRKSIKAAIREIEQVAAMNNIDEQTIRIDVSEYTSSSNMGYPKMSLLDTKAKRDAYMRS